MTPRSEVLHTCHNPHCGRQIPAKYVCHFRAWKRVPGRLRSRLWAAYRSGQEIDKRPSAQYLDALEAVLDYLRDNHVQCFPADEGDPRPGARA